MKKKSNFQIFFIDQFNFYNSTLKKVPDERLGEDICVWIIRKPGSQLNEEDVKNYCKGNISHFKIPRYIKFVDRFIINANNKALKHKMREETIKEHNT